MIQSNQSKYYCPPRFLEFIDTIMINYDKKYPEYNFSRNKGYGTKDHMNKIDKLGICNIHRKNFKPMSTTFSQSIKY